MARKILLSLFAAHALILLVALQAAGFKFDENFTLTGLLALNALAVAGIATRTRPGWFVAMVFVAAAVGHYAFHLGVDGASGLLTIVGIAGAVLCVTDPALRREHGIAT